MRCRRCAPVPEEVRRAAGLLGSWDRDPTRFDAEHGWRELFTPDPRYGVSIEEWLRQNWVVEGDARLQRWQGYGYNPHVLFDPDNVSDGKAAFECAPDAPHEWSKGEFLCPDVPAGTPPFAVPPLSESVIVIMAVPFWFAAGVNCTLPVALGLV